MKAFVFVMYKIFHERSFTTEFISKKLGKIDKNTMHSERYKSFSFYITSLKKSIIPEYKSWILYYTVISCPFVE